MFSRLLRRLHRVASERASRPAGDLSVGAPARCRRNGLRCFRVGPYVTSARYWRQTPYDKDKSGTSTVCFFVFLYLAGCCLTSCRIMPSRTSCRIMPSCHTKRPIRRVGLAQLRIPGQEIWGLPFYLCLTVSSRSFNTQKFKSRVSNLISKYIELWVKP